MLELTEIKRLHDKAFVFSQTTREEASNDLVFYWVTQWDDSILSESQLAYRGEFNILRKAGRQILADLESNPVQVDFEPTDENRTDAGDVLDGIYRADDRDNSTIESYSVGQQESVVCGVGAWELYTSYKTRRSWDKEQVIKRRPIQEAVNTVFWDPNAKLLDKSDAVYCSKIASYSEDGYKKLVSELLNIDEDEVQLESFSQPQISYSFPWILGESKKYYVVNFYHRELVKDKLILFTNPFGQNTLLYESRLEEVMDELIEAGYEIEDEKEVERYQVTKYIASGIDILYSEVVAGEYIPIIPIYGEHAFIEGEEHYEGATRLTKDPQRLRNFQLSYLADIVSRSPRKKPIFFAEQIANYREMYSESGADNNFPYFLQNRTDPSGNELPLGPVGYMENAEIPPALAESIALSRQAVEDVANPGLPQDIADPEISGKAVLALQSRLDQQSLIYQTHMKHAKRHDGVVYSSMASEIYDVPRTVKIVKPDGSKTTVQLMETVIDKETGDIKVLNDISQLEFDVFSTIGPSYSTKKDQTLDKLSEILVGVSDDPELKRVIVLSMLSLMDGINLDNIRDYANKQLVIAGVRKPITDEEIEFLQQAQEAAKNNVSPEMLIGQAEMIKAQSEQMRERREVLKLQLNAANEEQKRLIDTFNAETKRMEAQIDAAEAKATIKTKNIEAFGKKVENSSKILDLTKIREMSNQELMRQVSGS